MQKKDKFIFRCQSCGGQAPKWMGKCPDCGAWDTLVEERISSGVLKMSTVVKPERVRLSK